MSKQFTAIYCDAIEDDENDASDESNPRAVAYVRGMRFKNVCDIPMKNHIANYCGAPSDVCAHNRKPLYIDMLEKI